MGQYTPGYVDVPGIGKRYRDENGKYYHNHLGASLTQIGNLFGNPGVGRTTEQHVIGDDGSIGGRVKPSKRSEPKPAAPPQATKGSTMINRSGVTPVNGSFRTAVDQSEDGNATPSSGNAGSGGQSINPGGSNYIPPTGTGGSETRENGNGVVQRGLTLGGVNDFLAGQNIGTLSDMNKMYSQTEKNTDMTGYSLSDADQEYDVSDGAYPGKRTAFTQTATTPETTSDPSDMQDGASDEPDLADQIRAVRVNRGARQQEFAERPGNQSSSEPKNSGTNWGDRTMADNSDVRARMRSAFLDGDRGSLQALRAAEKEAGIFKQNGKVFYNEGGELKEATENSTQFYRTAMQGKNPMEFADTPVDSPAPSEISPVQAATAGMNMAPVGDNAEKPEISSIDAAAAGQAFAQDYIDRVKKQNK